jgi:hypothetical protein
MIRRFNIIVLLLLFSALSLWSGQASAEENGPGHASPLLLSPKPQLKWDTWKEMLQETGKPGSEIDCRVKMIVSQGQVQSATMVQSTGFKSADGEICEWVQKTWHFKPEAKGAFTLPVMLHLPMAVPAPDSVRSVAFYTSAPPFAPQVMQQLQKQADHQKHEAALNMVITVQVSRGQIVACVVSTKTGTVLDYDVPFWVKDKWVFKKGVTGTWRVPLVFAVKPTGSK